MSEARWQAVAQEALPGLYKLAWGILRHDADAQDAVQNALLKSWQSRDRVEDSKCRVYLTRIVINECRNIQRSRMRQIPVDEMPEAAAPAHTDLLREVEAAMAQLPEKYRLPVYLRYLQDFSEQEGAAALGIPVSAYRSRLHRARIRLREILEREVELP